MNRLATTLIAAAATGFAFTASAADLRAPAPVYKAPPPVLYNWTGWYLGANAGYSWGTSKTDSVATTPAGLFRAGGSTKFDMDGWVAGGQIGHNWQVSPRWVWGLEADLQATGEEGGVSFFCSGAACSPGQTAIPIAASPVTGNFSHSLEWFGTVRARGGYLFTPTLLGYVTGGLAYGELETNGNISGFTALGVPTSASFSSSTIKAGWTVGAGLEGKIAERWTAKLEYLYMDLGKFSSQASLLTNVDPVVLNINSRFTDHILRVGVNYHFYRPVVAKY
jgi:outer membrane immunogenic protein